MSQSKTFDGVMSLDEPNDVIGFRHHKEAKNGVFKGNAPNMHFTSIRGNKPISNTNLPLYACILQGNAVYIPKCDLAGTATYIPQCDLQGNAVYIPQCNLNGTATYISNNTPQWVDQGYTTCVSLCSTSQVQMDENIFSPTSGNFRAFSSSEGYIYFGTTSPTPGTCNYTENWQNTGATRCNNCVSQIEQQDMNPCSPSYTNKRWINGGSACNYNPVYNIPDGNGYWTCIPPGTTQNNTIYKNSNPCFTGDQWYLLGSTYATKPPTNSEPSTLPDWQQYGDNYCLGVDLYQPQRQMNPCAVNYLGVRDIPIETPSNSCAESYSLLDCASGGTGFSIAYPKGTFSLNQRVTSGGATYVINALAFATQAGNLAITSTGQTGCPTVYTIVKGCLDDQYWSIPGPIYYSGNIVINATLDIGGDQCATVMGQEETASYPVAQYVSSGCACN